jgi:hypothetical protein
MLAIFPQILSNTITYWQTERCNTIEVFDKVFIAAGGPMGVVAMKVHNSSYAGAGVAI